MLLVLAALLILGGGVWLAQGLNLPFAPGSFMTGDPLWVVVGGAAVLAGLALGMRGLRDRRPPPEDEDEP
jgi:hypothetical protein